MNLALWRGLVTPLCFLAATSSAMAQLRLLEDDGHWRRLDSPEAQKVLEKAVPITQAAYVALRTWSGRGSVFIRDTPRTAAMRESLLLPGGVISSESMTREYSGTFEFDCDNEGNRLWTCFVPESAAIVERGSGELQLVDHEWNERWTLLTPGESATLRPHEKVAALKADPVAIGWSPYTSRVLRLDTHERAARFAKFADVIDPRQAFRITGKQWATQLELILTSLEVRPESVFVEVGASDRGELYRSTSDFKTHRYRMTIDPSVGFNLVQYERFDIATGILRDKVTIVYSLIDGVFVPARMERALYERGSEKSHERAVALDQLEVNQPIEEARFTLAAFELKTGDRVLDTRSDELRLVGPEGSLVTPDAFEAIFGTASHKRAQRTETPLDRHGATNRSIYVVIAINGLAVVGICVWLVIRRMSRRRDSESREGADSLG